MSNGNIIRIGRYTSKETAAMGYDNISRKINVDKSRLNFANRGENSCHN